MPIRPATGISDGIGTACVGCADYHQRLRTNRFPAEQGEQQFIRVLQVLDDLEHEDQVKTFWQEILGVLHNGQSITMTLLGNAACVSRRLDAKAVPAPVCCKSQVITVAAADVENGQLGIAFGKAIQELCHQV